jgi:hypothetical protein
LDSIALLYSLSHPHSPIILSLSDPTKYQSAPWYSHYGATGKDPWGCRSSLDVNFRNFYIMRK